MHIVINIVQPRRKLRVATAFRCWCTPRVRAFLVTKGKKRTYLAALPIIAKQHQIQEFARQCDNKIAQRGVPDDERARLVVRLLDRVRPRLIRPAVER
jgi:hypothetical protein